jgi:hypothetical protein
MAKLQKLLSSEVSPELHPFHQQCKRSKQAMTGDFGIANCVSGFRSVKHKRRPARPAKLVARALKTL